MEGMRVDAATPMALVLMKFLLDTLFSFIAKSPFLSDFFGENIQEKTESIIDLSQVLIFFTNYYVKGGGHHNVDKRQTNRENMRLLEFEAKEILARHQIAVPKSQLLSGSNEINLKQYY
jgi:hypothetical protein